MAPAKGHFLPLTLDIWVVTVCLAQSQPLITNISEVNWHWRDFFFCLFLCPSKQHNIKLAFLVLFCCFFNEVIRKCEATNWLTGQFCGTAPKQNFGALFTYLCFKVAPSDLQLQCGPAFLSPLSAPAWQG